MRGHVEEYYHCISVARDTHETPCALRFRFCPREHRLYMLLCAPNCEGVEISAGFTLATPAEYGLFLYRTIIATLRLIGGILICHMQGIVDFMVTVKHTAHTAQRTIAYSLRRAIRMEKEASFLPSYFSAKSPMRSAGSPAS